MINENDPKYDSDKYFVESVIDFLQLISYKNSKLSKNTEYIFRGQANSEWSLLPSLAVTLNENNSLLKFESNMVNEFIINRPNEFHDMKDPIDVLAKMQHYGLPTRLLDVTFNPLVALYFACKSDNNKDKDGEVFMFQKQKHIPFRFSIDIKARTVWGMYDFFGDYFEEISQKRFLSAAVKNSLFSENDAKEYEYFYAPRIDMLLNTEPIVIIPTVYSERQYRQKAAFLLYQNEIIKKDKEANDFDNCFFIRHIKDFKDSVINDMKTRVIVKRENKNSIAKQLDNLGICEEFLFPEMEHAAKYIKEKYLNM